jgi:hypothetical protein
MALTRPTPNAAIVDLDEPIMVNGEVWRVEATVKLGAIDVVELVGAVGPHCVFVLGARAWDRFGKVGAEVVRERLVELARASVRRGLLRKVP